MRDYSAENENIVFPEKVIKPFVSKLGDFNFQQERLIHFTTGWKMIIFILIDVVAFGYLAFVMSKFLNIDLDSVGLNTTFITILFVLAMVLGLIIPFIKIVVFISSKRLKVFASAKAVNVYLVYLKIARGIYGLLAAFLGYMGILIIVKAFIVGLLYFLLMGVMFYIAFKFLSLLIEFFESIRMNFRGRKKLFPDPTTITKYLVVFLVISTADFLYSLVSNDFIDPALVDAVYPSLTQIVVQLNEVNSLLVISGLIGLLSSAYEIYFFKAFGRECFESKEPVEYVDVKYEL